MADHYKSVCTIVLSQNDAHQIEAVKAFLLVAGLEIDSIDMDTGTIEATGDTDMVSALEEHHLFQYVRTSLKYWCCQKQEI